MKQYLLLAASAFLLQGCQTSKEDIKEQPLKMIEQIDFSHVKINDNFWSPRLSKHVSATLPVCIDQIENQTGRIRNFENAAKGEGEHSGIFFDDSDVYKALEGMAYSLINNPDPELEKKADEWIDKFAAAQQPDGYINTFYTLTGLDKRWTNMDKHEMYCAGHMIEAGVAYYQATGKRKLLDVCMHDRSYDEPIRSGKKTLGTGTRGNRTGACQALSNHPRAEISGFRLLAAGGTWTRSRHYG